MGLLYTKFYIDFEDADWRQSSADPPEFEARRDGVSLEIEDTSHKLYKIRLKKGGRIEIIRLTGRFRLRWDDADSA